MATKKELANIAKLQNQVNANKQKVVGTMSSISPTISKVDPAQGLDLALTAKKNAKPGSAEYVKAVNAVTQARNAASGLTTQRDTLRNRISTGVGTTGVNDGMSGILQQLLADQNAASAEAQQSKEQTRKSAIDVLTARFKEYGLESLSAAIVKLATDGASEATITLALQETPEYQKRFKANIERIKNGTTVLSPGDYLNLEDTYRQVLRSYGLKQFDNDEYVSQFIGNDMSATELAGRVDTAVKRVQNADPAVMQQLTEYYGIGSKDLVAYVLDPKKQLGAIERQVQAGEIGAAATKQGLITGKSVAEQLAAAGVTQAEAEKGYSTIADVLPTASKLSEIYGSKGDSYTQSDAEKEVFGGLASAKRKREKLVATEVGAFSGQSGAARGAFSSGYLSKQSRAGQI